MTVKFTKKGTYSDHLNPKEYSVASITATTSIKKPGVEIDEKDVVVKNLIIPTAELCRVMVGGSYTVNLGNYESAKIHVELSIPFPKTEIEQAYDFASEWVSKKVEEAVKQAKGG